MGLLSAIFGQKDNANLIEAIQQGAILIDVRSAHEFSSGSVNGAINIPVEKITAQLNTLNNNTRIIVFCQSGVRSKMAQSLLEKNGFKNVLNGGSWQNVKKLTHD